MNERPNTVRTLTREQRVQEEEYDFPYHYLPSFRPHFSLHRPFVWGLNYVASIEFILAELDSLEFSTVADIGCGDGRLAREIAISFPDRSVIGIDYSAHAIALAEAMNPNISNLIFRSLDITDALPLPDADVAVLMEVLEHIPPPQCSRFLAGVAKTLRDGGTLLMTVPSSNVPVTPKHFRHFTPALLRKELEPHFTIDALVPFEKITFRRKIIAGALSNRYFSITNRTVCNALYKYYKRVLFKADDSARCQRLYVKATRR